MPNSPPKNETVILLHGLGRSSTSMKRMEGQLAREGYAVHNIGYSTRGAASIEEIIDTQIRPAVAAADVGQPVHFVGHSLGGILARGLIAVHRPKTLGRLVMLGPPNQGSELSDTLEKLPLVRSLTSPAAKQLGTGTERFPARLPKPDYEVGVIAGDFTWNPLYSAFIEGPDDGKVSVERAKVAGMKDFVVVPYSHTWLMWRRKVLRQTRHFLEHGTFEPR